MDAHCFIFTDMVLICKPVGRKGERMKVIRQPYIVDRLVLKELNKDPCSFGLVYLNEYGTASAALSLHFNEPKLVKVTMDHIKKTQKIYNEVKEKVSSILWKVLLALPILHFWHELVCEIRFFVFKSLASGNLEYYNATSKKT